MRVLKQKENEQLERFIDRLAEVILEIHNAHTRASDNNQVHGSHEVSMKRAEEITEMSDEYKAEFLPRHLGWVDAKEAIEAWGIWCFHQSLILRDHITLTHTHTHTRTHFSHTHTQGYEGCRK